MRLTPTQSAVVGFIRHCIEDDGRPPTIREVSAFVGSKNPMSGSGHIKALVRKGCIEITPNVSRGIRLVERLESGGREAELVAAARSIFDPDAEVDLDRLERALVPYAGNELGNS